MQECVHESVYTDQTQRLISTTFWHNTIIDRVKTILVNKLSLAHFSLVKCCATPSTALQNTSSTHATIDNALEQGRLPTHYCVHLTSSIKLSNINTATQ